MGEKFDDMKGRVKEGVGEATDNEDLEREGKIERTEAKVKDKVDEVADKVKSAFKK